METNIFKKQYDDTLLAYSVLKRLGAGNVNIFKERLKSQKIQYFAQLFEVSPVYVFNLYLRGPYSPDLAYDLYEIKKEKFKSEQKNLYRMFWKNVFVF
ncbi:MAG: hypothetical protein ABIG90_02020 [bacterium]